MTAAGSADVGRVLENAERARGDSEVMWAPRPGLWHVSLAFPLLRGSWTSRGRGRAPVRLQGTCSTWWGPAPPPPPRHPEAHGRRCIQRQSLSEGTSRLSESTSVGPGPRRTRKTREWAHRGKPREGAGRRPPHARKGASPVLSLTPASGLPNAEKQTSVTESTVFDTAAQADRDGRLARNPSPPPPGLGTRHQPARAPQLKAEPPNGVFVLRRKNSPRCPRRRGGHRAGGCELLIRTGDEQSIC